MTEMLYFVVENNGGPGNVRVKLGKFVHFFLDTVLETSGCIEVTSRKLNIHYDTSVILDGNFRLFRLHLEYIHLFFGKKQVFCLKKHHFYRPNWNNARFLAKLA
jgi:hypothetical protein